MTDAKPSAEERARKCVRIDDDWSELAKASARLAEEQIAREIRAAELAAAEAMRERIIRLLQQWRVLPPSRESVIRALPLEDADG